MRKSLYILFLAFALVLQTNAQKQEDMRQAVKYLASQELGGRYPGTAGDTLASEYIVEQLRSLKLKPVVKSGLLITSSPCFQEKTSNSKTNI